MEKEKFCGLMVLSMKESGNSTKLVDRVNSTILTVMSTKVHGSTIKPMASANT